MGTSEGGVKNKLQRVSFAVIPRVASLDKKIMNMVWYCTIPACHINRENLIVYIEKIE